jgi:hypothetical protein
VSVVLPTRQALHWPKPGSAESRAGKAALAIPGRSSGEEDFSRVSYKLVNPTLTLRISFALLLCHILSAMRGFVKKAR